MIAIDPELEAVARYDIPERYAHVVGVSISPNGKYAVVLVATNEEPAVELELTIAERAGGRWEGCFSGTPGALAYAGDHRAAVLCNDDPLPPDVERVVVRDRGAEHEVPVEAGYFLYVAWQHDGPGDATDPPQPEFVGTISA